MLKKIHLKSGHRNQKTGMFLFLFFVGAHKKFPGNCLIPNKVCILIFSEAEKIRKESLL